METEQAQILVATIAGAAAVVWLFGLQYLAASRKPLPPGGGLDCAEPSSPDCILGRAEIEGRPDMLAARTAAALAQGNPFGSVRIVDKADDRVGFERLGPGDFRRGAGSWTERGAFRFAPAGHGRSQVEWTGEMSRMGLMIALGALFQVLGLAAIAIGFWAMWTYVVVSPSPAVRWQSFQMLQVAHFLWPPFLFGSLCRRGKRDAAARFESLVQNLPFLKD